MLSTTVGTSYFPYWWNIVAVTSSLFHLLFFACQAPIVPHDTNRHDGSHGVVENDLERFCREREAMVANI
jgi:hypothetical protein